MRLRVNGQAREVAAGLSVAALLGQLGVGAAAAVVEVNGVITARPEFETTMLDDGDVIEIVRVVGGG